MTTKFCGTSEAHNDEEGLCAAHAAEVFDVPVRRIYDLTYKDRLEVGAGFITCGRQATKVIPFGQLLEAEEAGWLS